MTEPRDPERVVRQIKRKTRRKSSAEENIRIVLEGLRGEEGVAGLCRSEGISPNPYYTWSKAFLEAGQQRDVGLAGDGRPYLYGWHELDEAAIRQTYGESIDWLCEVRRNLDSADTLQADGMVRV
jgi:transposase